MIRLPQQTNAAAWCNNLIHRQHVDDARWSSSHRYQSQILVENGDFLYQLGSTNYNIVTKFGIETLEWYGWQEWKNYEYTITRFDAIHECDRQMDKQTPHDGIGSAYAQHHMAIILTAAIVSWVTFQYIRDYSNKSNGNQYQNVSLNFTKYSKHRL